MHPGDARTTVTLTERTPADCRLEPADVEFLLAAHRPHLDLVPTRERDRFRLIPRGHVGTIVAPHCRLLIRPKLPVRNLFFLLDPDASAPPEEDRTTAGQGSDLLDFLATRLARLLAECAACGLHRAYVERPVQGPFVQGRLDLPAQLRDAPGRKARVHCRHEDFTADVPCNQVPRATAELVLRSLLLGEAACAALRRSLGPFADVSLVSLGPDLFAAVEADRLAGPYRPLLDLCRLLAEALGPGATAGAAPCPAFLLDLERVFERYCIRHFAAAWDGRDDERGRWRVAVQPHLRPHPAGAGQPDLAMRPDMMLECDRRPVLVVDAKWKRLRKLITADVYQVLAYCAALGVARGALVYPGRRNRAWEYRFTAAPVRLTVHTVRVTGPREACGAAARRWARAVARDSISRLD